MGDLGKFGSGNDPFFAFFAFFALGISMGKYLEIAQKALEQAPDESTQHCCTAKDQSLTGESADSSANSHCEISELSEISPVTDHELREILEDDWDEISKDLTQLESARRSATVAKQIEAGIEPAHYISTTTCKHCGPVPIWEGCPPEVQGCPWCFNRLKGLSIPRGANKR